MININLSKFFSNNDIKVNKMFQRNVLICTIVVSLAIIYLFNLFWEPVLFVIYITYIVLNKGRSITLKERIGLVCVVGLLSYSMIARLFGMGPSLFIIVPIMIISLIVVWKAFGDDKK